MAAILIVAIVALVAGFQLMHTNDTGRPALNAKLLTDPQPNHGKDCPYPPRDQYGQPVGHVAPGRDKHCNG